MIITLQNLLPVDQGKFDDFKFYITTINSDDLINHSNVERLHEGYGVQRYLNEQRTKDIARFCEQNDAIFPTPIIVSLNTDFIVSEDIITEGNLIPKMEIDTSLFDNIAVPFSIIDGQHRLAGIEKYRENNKDSAKKFILPLIIYKDASIETSARIFVTINSNQRSVDRSTISQLFGIIYQDSDIYTVESFASTIVTALNNNEASPFYNGIKLLGRKNKTSEFISQGTVAKKIIDRITTNTQSDNLDIEKGRHLKEDSNKIFRKYFIDNKPENVTEFMINYFSAFELCFPDLWYGKNLLTKKAVGFSGLMKFFTEFYIKHQINDFVLLEKYFSSKEANLSDLIKIFSNENGSSESVANEISNKLMNILG